MSLNVTEKKSTEVILSMLLHIVNIEKLLSYLGFFSFVLEVFGGLRRFGGFGVFFRVA